LFFIKNKRKLGKPFKVIVNVIILTALVSFSYKVIDIINEPEQYFSASDSAGASGIERALQYRVSVDLVMQSLWRGYGKGLELDNEGFLMYIDSYVLVVLLEGGLVGFSFFLLMWVVVFNHGRALIHSSINDRNEFNIAIALIVGVTSLLLYQFFTSYRWDNIYLYVFEGLIVSQLINPHSKGGKEVHDNMTDRCLVEGNLVHQK